MENTNLIRKIVNSFANTTGLEYEDLFQEASLAYLEALRTYDPQRGRITTHIWHCVSNKLKNYLKEQEKQNAYLCPLNEMETEKEIMNVPFWESLSKEAIQIAEVVLTHPKTYLKLGKTHSPKKLKQVMSRKGWNNKKIKNSLLELKFVFSS